MSTCVPVPAEVILGNVLAELLDLLDLAGQLVGERLLQRLQLALSATFYTILI